MSQCMLQPIDGNDLFFKSIDHEIKKFQQVHLEIKEGNERINSYFKELDVKIGRVEEKQKETRREQEDLKRMLKDEKKFNCEYSITRVKNEIDSTKTGIRWLITTITVLAVGILLGIVLGALGHYAACATLISISGIGSAISIPFLVKNYQELGTLELKRIELEKKLKDIS